MKNLIILMARYLTCLDEIKYMLPEFMKSALNYLLLHDPPYSAIECISMVWIFTLHHMNCWLTVVKWYLQVDWIPRVLCFIISPCLLIKVGLRDTDLQSIILSRNVIITHPCSHFPTYAFTMQVVWLWKHLQEPSKYLLSTVVMMLLEGRTLHSIWR